MRFDNCSERRCRTEPYFQKIPLITKFKNTENINTVKLVDVPNPVYLCFKIEQWIYLTHHQQIDL
jgi:hypothetical protein